MLDAETVVQVLLEIPEGIANADEIARLDGVDIVAIGANDLTAELDAVGDYRDPRVRDAVETVAKACQAHGKLLMLGGIPDLDVLDSLLPLGVAPLLLSGMDTDLLYAGARTRTAALTTWWQRS